MTTEEKRQALISFCYKKDDCFLNQKPDCPLINANCYFEKLPDETINEYYKLAIGGNECESNHN